jgi:hypothetical protein
MATTYSVVYKKRYGVLRNPAIRAEIAALDAKKDCQRIVHLLACYEFPFDISRCLELALFHTYASISVSRLLDQTNEFERHGQKRYDDTRLLISHFMEEGYDSEYGRRAIERMNAIHGNGRISNDDFLFVLSTFISYPIDWLKQYGYRPLTAHEELAWFTFYRNVGIQMHLRDIPETWQTFRQWVAEYEASNLVYAPSNRNVANATIRIFESWLPWPLHRCVQPAVRALISPKLIQAFGFEPAPKFLAYIIQCVLWLRKQFMRLINIERHPKLIANTLNRTYPKNTYSIEAIAPSYMKPEAGNQDAAPD